MECIAATLKVPVCDGIALLDVECMHVRSTANQTLLNTTDILVWIPVFLLNYERYTIPTRIYGWSIAYTNIAYRRHTVTRVQDESLWPVVRDR